MKHVELFEFFVEGRDQDMSHVLLHITEPSTRDEFDKGYFFALIEIEKTQADQIEHIQEMIDDIESAYYNTGADEAGDSGVLEFVLESMNRHSKDILNSASIVHSLVGVIRENHLSFSYHGLPHGLLLYKRKGEIERIDMIQEQSSEEEKQLFPSVLEGELNDGDTFLLATPHVSQYFSYDRLQKIVLSRGLRQGVEHIQKVLYDLKEDISFGGIAIRVIPPEETPRTGKKPRSKEGSAESLNKLLESERATAETLSPPILGNLTKKKNKRSEKPDDPSQSRRDAKKTTHGKTETNYRPRTGQPKSSLFEVVLIHLGRAMVYGGRWFFGVLRTLAIMISRLIIMLVILVTNKNNGRRQIIDSFQRKIRDTKEAITALPLLSKILFVGAIIFATTFVASISYMRFKENIEAEKEQYAFTVQAIEDKASAADAAIIYGDDAKAFDLVKEAELLLDVLHTENSQESYERLREHLDIMLADLRKMQSIEPELVADLAQYSGDARMSDLAMIDTTLIAYTQEQPEYLSINTNTHSIEKKTHDSSVHPASDTTPKENDTIIFLNGTNGIAEYQKDSATILEKDISFPGDEPTIVDGFIYNVKLYTLDATGEQIYKHNKTQTGYDKGTPWITQKTSSLAGAKSFAIDSDIYILETTGTIRKFEKGVERLFTTKGLDPALEMPTEIWTYADIDNIYILEPTHRRIVVLDKTGGLVQQYTSASWEHPDDMIIDSENNMIYVLDANRVYRFGL